MATFSSHLLDATNGSHAANVDVIIYQINENGKKKVFCETKSDEGGRILQEFELSKDDCKCDYEMVCKTGNYFSEKKIVSEIKKIYDPEIPVNIYELVLSLIHI